MKIIALNGENRRVKTFLFLCICFTLACAPHFVEFPQRFYPGLAMTILLGMYGLRVVLRDGEGDYVPLVEDIPNTLNSEFYPSVDVLVAARDEENVIERLVTRLSNIQYPKDKISIFIIDDGSIDQTPYLLKKLIKNLSNFTIITRNRSDGGGKSGALNCALKQIKGEWVFILDADAAFKKDILLRLIPFANKLNWSALQLRKAVINPNQSPIACCQAMEMAMDAVIQRGRMLGGGVVELRGNGQLINRSILDLCGGFNEGTVTDDLDLSFRFLISGVSLGIVWDPPVEEEAVSNFSGLIRQRKRWAEGGLQRFFDYWPFLTSSKINLIKRHDLACFFILQYALPIISLFDIVIAIITRSQPLYWPLSFIAFGVSGLAFWRGCCKESEGPSLPAPKPLTLLMAIIYMGHWFVVIPWVTLRMALFPKRLLWAKTLHSGT